MRLKREINESFSFSFFVTIFTERDGNIMNFDDVLEKVLRDQRVKEIPILYVIQLVIIMDDLGMF